MSTFGTGTFGAGVFGVGEVTNAPQVGAPTQTPAAGQPYVVTYRPLIGGQPVDVTSVDRLDLYSTPARTGLPVLTVSGPAVRVGAGQYAFPAAVMPAAGTYYAVVTFTAGDWLLSHDLAGAARTGAGDPGVYA